MVKQEKEIEWIDIHDEDLMIRLGIHYPDYEEVDFSKTPKERKQLNKMKHSCNELCKGWPYRVTSSYPLVTKLIVCLKKNNSYPKTTYSYKASMSQIPNILKKFVSKKGNNIVDHYTFNGYTYQMGEYPVNPHECGKRVYKKRK